MEATDFPARLARADLVITGEGRIDAQTGFGKTALGVAKRAAAAGVPCIAVGGGVEPDGIAALAGVGAVAVPVVERPQSIEEAMAAGTAPLERTAANGSPGWCRHGDAGRRRRGRRSAARRSAGSRTPARATRSDSSGTGPGLVRFTLDELAGLYGRPVWERRLDPTSELILTILTQNSADVNAEVAFEALRHAYPSGLPAEAHQPGRRLGWGRASRWGAARLERPSSSRRSPS